MRYADNWDWLLLTVGILTSIISGALSPAGSLVFRGITDVLMEGQHEHKNGTLDSKMDHFSEGSEFILVYFNWPTSHITTFIQVIHYILLYFVFGIFALITTKLSVSFEFCLYSTYKFPNTLIFICIQFCSTF
jgi:hypothetical protein